MPLDVMLVVLLAALIHALWNALLRSASDKFQSSLLIVCGAAVLSLLLLPFIAAPARASWPYLLASGLIHVGYYTLLALSYSSSSLGFAYPVMRGSAPVIAALAAVLVLNEFPSLGQWLGIGLICLGVLLLAGAAWKNLRWSAIGFALANAGVIAAYTLIDGQGARLSGQALSYTAWVFILTAVFMLAYVRLRRQSIGTLLVGPHVWRTAGLGGLGTLAAYSMVLWAMTLAPIAAVAALREMSIVFAALIGALFLHEHLNRWRVLAVSLVCAGAMVIKLY
jgi:drug/metabolite transporter (DMT)-like permease